MGFKVAVDGTSSSGKGSVAKKIGKHFKFLYIDTGAMYRAVALNALKFGIELLPENESQILEATKKMKLNMEFGSDSQKMYLDGDDITDAIRTVEAGENASKVASLESIREYLVEYQQNLAKDEDVVMDGRDIGSVVLKDAEVKLYLDADSLTRAKRRCAEVLAKGEDVDLKGVQEALEIRDYRDKNRAVSPLILCDDAVYIDTSNLTLEEVLEKVYKIIEDKRESK